jgi:hypothetical protein
MTETFKCGITYLMATFEILDGSIGLTVDEVAHVIVPGRGRNANGDGLSIHSLERADFAATFYLSQQLENSGGIIIPSGYKSPADKSGEVWAPINQKTDVYRGVPEAESMRLLLLKRGIGETAISVERNSFDTVTNFVYCENKGHFPDDRPVAIVAQEQQLERIIEVIAPKTLRRDYLGIVVPEGEVIDRDTVFAKIVSFIVLVGIKPDSNKIIEKTTSRASKIWSIVNSLQRN